jgi:hypothetical protein
LLRNNVIHAGARIQENQIDSAIDVTKNLLVFNFGADIITEIKEYSFALEKLDVVGELLNRIV